MAGVWFNMQCDMWAEALTLAALLDQESQEDDFLDHTGRTRTSVEPISDEEGTGSSKRTTKDSSSGKSRKRARKSSTIVAKRTRGGGAQPSVKAAESDGKNTDAAVALEQRRTALRERESKVKELRDAWQDARTARGDGTTTPAAVRKAWRRYQDFLAENDA